MYLDRLNQRVMITLLISLMVHAGVLSMFSLRRFSRPGKSLVLTDVEFMTNDKPYGVAQPAKPKPKPREVIDTTAKSSAATMPAPAPTPEPETLPEEAGDPNALPGGEASGKFFLPYYAVEQLPTFAKKVMPAYPESARKLERVSEVILEAYIDSTGVVRKIRVVRSGGDIFDQAAIRALEVSTFTPAWMNGKTVPVKLLIPYAFSLEKS